MLDKAIYKKEALIKILSNKLLSIPKMIVVEQKTIFGVDKKIVGNKQYFALRNKINSEKNKLEYLKSQKFLAL